MADKEETIALIIALLTEQEEQIAKVHIAQSQLSRRIIRDTLAQLETELARMQWGTWGAMERAATLTMIRRAFVQLGGELTGAMTQKIPEIVSGSFRSTRNFLISMDEQMEVARRGIIRPLRFDTLEFLERTNREVGQIRLREFPQSFRRYGAAAVLAIEEQLGVISLQGVPWTQARDEVWDAVRGVVRDKQWMVERILRTECLLPCTPVSGAVVRAAFRRWYQGSAIEIVTERGRSLTTTPNHPMLTRSGWIASDNLQKGDDLVCYVGDQDASVPGHEHVKTAPSTIAEVFDALAAIGVSKRRRTAQPDFHGDGMDGDVDVSCSAGVLAVGAFALIDEPLGQHVFTPADAALEALFCNLCHCLRGSEGHCLCGSSDWNISLPEACVDRDVSDRETCSNVVRAFACDVAPADALCRELFLARVTKGGEPIFGGVGTVPHESKRAQACAESASVGNSDRHAGTPYARAADIQFDRVMYVRVREYSGHVYNLSTVHGYFAIEGAITGNTSAIHNGTELAAIQEEAKDDIPGDEMKKRLVATWDPVTGPDSKYVHGQVRAPDEMFEDNVGRRYLAPPNRPNDREIVVPWRSSYSEFFPDYPRITKGEQFTRPKISVPKELQPVADVFTRQRQAEVRLLRTRVTDQRKLLRHFQTQMKTLDGDAEMQFGAQIRQVEFSIRQLKTQISALSG